MTFGDEGHFRISDNTLMQPCKKANLQILHYTIQLILPPAAKFNQLDSYYL